MNNRALLTLVLAGAIAVPVLAQQNDTSSQSGSSASQPAATQSQPADQQPAQPSAAPQPAAPADQSAAATQPGASGKAPLQPQTKEGFWGKLNPFARKKYVQRQTQPIRDRV